MLHRRRDRGLGRAPGSGEDEPFGEAPGCAFVVSGELAALESSELPGLTVVGRVGGERLSLRAGELVLNLAVSELRETRDSGLEKLVEGRC